MLYFCFTYLELVVASILEESELKNTQNDDFAEERRFVKALRYFRELKNDNIKRSAGNY